MSASVTVAHAPERADEGRRQVVGHLAQVADAEARPVLAAAAHEERQPDDERPRAAAPPIAQAIRSRRRSAATSACASVALLVGRAAQRRLGRRGGSAAPRSRLAATRESSLRREQRVDLDVRLRREVVDRQRHGAVVAHAHDAVQRSVAPGPDLSRAHRRAAARPRRARAPWARPSPRRRAATTAPPVSAQRSAASAARQRKVKVAAGRSRSANASMRTDGPPSSRSRGDPVVAEGALLRRDGRPRRRRRVLRRLTGTGGAAPASNRGQPLQRSVRSRHPGHRDRRHRVDGMSRYTRVKSPWNV